MCEQWRLIIDPPAKGSFNMAKDYALLLSVAEGSSSPVLRFYSWLPAAVTLGYFQDAEKQADLTRCRQSGVDVIRRITGGGAVFHQHEITYSMMFPVTHPFAGTDILSSYHLTLDPFIQTLSSFGLDAVYSPVNDITVSGEKISGNAQTRKKGCVLQHGTILLDIDRTTAFSCLTVPEDKTARKGLTHPSDRVTSLKEHLGDDVMSCSFTGLFIDRTLSAFSEHDIICTRSALSEKESLLTNQIESRIFSQESWNLHKLGELP